MGILDIQLGELFLELTVLTFQNLFPNRRWRFKRTLAGLSSPTIDDTTGELILAACCVDCQCSRFNFADDLVFESSFEFPSLLSHRSTPCSGLSSPPVEPIAPPSNYQIFSPVNGAQS